MKTTLISIGAPIGFYTPTLIDDAKAASAMTIEACNGGSYTLNPKGIALTGRGVKTQYSNGFVEVSAAKLKALQGKYNIQPNF